jgi:predicted nucleotidyltransferase/DNA-binding XRE family transcriptional regulator
MRDIGSTIRRTRQHAGLSQVELARRAGTSQSALARYEAGAALPTLPTLERLLQGCGRQLQLRVIGARGKSSHGSSARGRLGPQASALRRHRRSLLETARSHGARSIRVFGSVARGDADGASDIDLLVELESDRTLLDVLAFRREAERLLGMPVDVATPDILKQRIRDQVLAEALPL